MKKKHEERYHFLDTTSEEGIGRGEISQLPIEYPYIPIPNFSSYHPLQGVIRSLLDRCETLVKEEEDKWKEREHIKVALARCGYPQWIISTVQTKVKTKKEDNIGKKTVEKDKSKSMAVLPYVQGLSETTSRIMKKYNVNTALKPHNTIKRSLVRPKDKVEPQRLCERVYSITCKNCNATYIRETKRTLGTKLNVGYEHKEDADKASACRPYTRSNRKTSETEMPKSAITDHMTQQNHIVVWTGAKFIDRVSDWRTRGTKEVIWIKKTKDSMNRNEGRYRLLQIYDDLLKGHPRRGRGGHTPQ